MRQGPCDDRPLTLSARDIVDRPVREVPDIGLFHCLHRQTNIFRTFQPDTEQAAFASVVRKSSHHHCLGDREREYLSGFLGDERHQPCDRILRHRFNPRAEEVDLPFLRSQDPRQ